jgi:hypothetical protein
MWVAIGLGAVVALLAWVRSRRTARRLELLTKQFWELRYEFGELRARVTRLDPDVAPAESSPAEAPGQTFIPLSSLKR